MSYNTELQNNNQELRGILEDVNNLPEYPQVPTKISELENDSGFITKVVSDLANYYPKSQTFTRDEINAKISAIPKFAISVVSSLPTSNISTSTIYLLSGGSGSNLYTEYIYSGGKWEILGAQTVDLTGYATETWVNTQLGSYLKQTELDAAINTALAAAKASGEFDGKDGEDYVLTDADKVEIAGMSGGVIIPEYWQDELDTKADAIQAAMEKAGRNKSAFLWYTDAHWVNGNSKVSPKLLNYLYMNTPMNKVNFGGDIIGDTLLATREEMKYLYEWRKAIKNLPNHHSVFGNHDMFNLDTVDYEDDNYRYAFLLAPEESYDQVWGNGNYYYIDNPAEKTRYLYICYPNTDTTWLLTQTQFIADSLNSTPEGWHIVAIAHRWWQYSKSSTPTVGSIPGFEKDVLSVFDAYNARTTRSGSNYFYAQDFTDGKATVEFCIGGHIHVDYDFFSDGGIPVIITTADTNQNRVPDSTVDSGTVGTITEAAVFGIIADYNDIGNTKITVVGVGRGTSRVVRASNIKPVSITNISYSGDTTIGATIDKNKFSFTVKYSNGTTDTVNGATSASPATIGAVGNNSVTITYTEGATTLTASATIVGTPVPVVNLLNLNRTYVAGTVGEYLYNHLDESKAYTNVAYSTKVFNATSCTASDITENSVTVKESGLGGIAVAYAIYLPGITKDAYRLTFDYAGTGKCRTYYGYAANGTAGQTYNMFINDTAGASGSADITIPANTDNYTWLIIMFSSNTGSTKTYSNVSLTKA